jgi:hypothetical protein
MVRALYNVSFCNLEHYIAGTNYLAYCGDTHYGDFEHQVFYDGSFDTAQRLREADVLVVGNSQVEIALSRSNVAPFFEQRRARFFLSAFGYVEGLRFPIAVFKRHKPTPKILIVNVSPGIDLFSPPARDALDRPISGPIDAIFKGLATPLYAVFCKNCGRAGSLLRSRQTGQWDLPPLDPTNNDGWPVKTAPPPPENDRNLQLWADRVRPLVSDLLASVPARCVVFTHVPRPTIPADAHVRKLAQYFDVHLILPVVPGLRTWDDNHLTGDSSIAWSNAFLQQLDALGPRCGAW